MTREKLLAELDKPLAEIDKFIECHKPHSKAPPPDSPADEVLCWDHSLVGYAALLALRYHIATKLLPEETNPHPKPETAPPTNADKQRGAELGPELKKISEEMRPDWLICVKCGVIANDACDRASHTFMRLSEMSECPAVAATKLVEKLGRRIEELEQQLDSAATLLRDHKHVGLAAWNKHSYARLDSWLATYDTNIPRSKTMKAIELIAFERQRQRDAEGFTDDHDNCHGESELAMAAACYASPAELYIVPYHHRSFAAESADGDEICYHTEAWPWESKWDKRDKHDRKRQLVIAGALIVAELERLERKEQDDD